MRFDILSICGLTYQFIIIDIIKNVPLRNNKHRKKRHMQPFITDVVDAD